ncbi:MAG TPA: ABC transporter substrate-binding protein [Gaiellaceae bacterium]
MTREDLLRRAAALGIVVVGGGSLGPLTEAALARTQIKRGGTFRIGIAGGGTTDFIDGQNIVNEPDIVRNVITFEGLAYFDEQYKPRIDGLAEEFVAEKPTQYLIRIRDGIEFHNGKTLTADDVVYSITRFTKAKLGLFGTAAFGAVDPKRIRKLDGRTVRLFLKRPDATLIDAFCQYFNGMVPEGYSPTSGRGKGPLRFVGTGAFKVKEFVPGRRSVHVRNENYWREGQPYFDEVQIINFADETARVNALLSGQILAAGDVPFAQVNLIRRRKGLRIYEAPSAAWDPLTMRVDQAPFTDVRVRQAFRLLANRPQMVAQGISGHGRVANDIFSPFDLCYAGDEFPQRKYDPERARALLKAAGREGLTIDLQTTAADSGMVEVAQIFAQNAKAGGVTVNVKVLDGATFYGDQYLKWTFATDFWGTRNYLAQCALATLPTATYNETHFNNARYNALYRQALGIVDRKKRCALIKEMQRIEYDQGGLIIPWFKNQVSAYSAKIGGFKIDVGTLDLNKYGNNFRTIYFV